jgi:hypothetical protein
MANDITQRNPIPAPSLAPERNWAEEYGDEAFQSNIIGTLLKYVKGDWLAGKDGDEVPLGTEMVAAMHLLQSGFIRWEDNKPVENLMGFRSEGFVPPERNTLGHHDKSTWRDFNGQLQDPWQRTDVLLMADVTTGEVYTYSPSSGGGLQAIKNLSRDYGSHMRTNPDEIPVIKLSSTSYQHKQFSKVYKPVLELVGWRDLNDVSFEVADDEAEEPAPAPRAVAAKPAPRVAPKAKAPPPKPVKRNGGTRARY